VACRCGWSPRPSGSIPSTLLQALGRLVVGGFSSRRCLTPQFNAPSMADILNAATSIFNPFVSVLALAIGVTLGARMLGRIVNLF